MNVSIMHPVLLNNTFLLLILFSFCIFVTSARQVHYEDEDSLWNLESDADCLTPQRQRGQCIRWTTCSPLNRITQWDRVRPYTCGFSGNEPMVCCPHSNESLITPPSNTDQPPPERQSRSPIVERPSFLPKECGESVHFHTRFVFPPEYASPGDWPWMALVFKKQRNSTTLIPDCGGALVTNRLVITAAHCILAGTNITSPRMLSVRLGAIDLREENETGSVQVEVDRVRIHENFDPRTYKNDIAILRLGRPVDFTDRIQPVCLPYDIDFSPGVLEDTMAILTGYGTLRLDGEPSNLLQDEGSVISSQETCRKSYEKEINITMEYLCASIFDSKCNGDSGSPLVKPRNQFYYLAGILSHGKMCGHPNYPEVYTRVSTYLDWLTNNMARLQDE